jgi:hypothetical protein
MVMRGDASGGVPAQSAPVLLVVRKPRSKSAADVVGIQLRMSGWRGSLSPVEHGI